MSDAWLNPKGRERSGRWQQVLVYFGLVDDPASPGGSTQREDKLLEALAALERRVSENTDAIEALRAEVARNRR